MRTKASGEYLSNKEWLRDVVGGQNVIDDETARIRKIRALF